MAANDVPCCEPMFWVYLIICVILVCFAGLMSGLTLGLMSLSLVDLEVLAKSGQPNDRLNAEKILPLVKNQHLLLCTLLIYNAMAMEALPIFVDSLLPAWASILISVTLILAFGEIIPQAICSQYGLSVGAKLSVLVRLLVIVLFPIAYPISKMLDWLLGKGHSALLRRSELKTFVDLHSHHAGKGGELTHDEITIIGGALELTTKTAKDAMTPLSKVFSLDIDSTLNKETMELIMNKGHSRVPIYSGNPTNIIGLILVKSLIFCRFEDETPVRNHAIRKISRLHDYLPLYEVLNQLKKCHSHMGIVVRSKHPPKDMSHPTTNSAISGAIHEYHVKEEKKTWRNTSMVNSTPKTGSHNIPVINVTELRESPTMKQEDATTLKVSDLEASSDSSEEEVIGIITMEDVMEELLQEEIYDETDYYVDEHNKIQINMMPGVKKSSSRSPGVSPCRTSPTLQSPTQGFVPSPLIRPTLISSPMRSRLASPTNTYTNETSTRSSPLLYVSTTSYEKLQH